MEVIHFINEADVNAGGAQKILHSIYNGTKLSRIIGFDYIYPGRRSCSKKSNFFIALFHLLYFGWFNTNSTTLVLHHRLFLLFTKFLLNKNLYFVCHNIFPSKNFVFKFASKNLKYVSVSDDVKIYLSNFIGERSCSVIYNGLQFNTDFIKNSKKNKHSYDIYFIGRLSSQKGVDLLINAFKKLSDNKSNLTLSIIGAGEQENYLRSISSGFEKIRFLGYHSTPFLLAKNADLIVIPSLFEGFGLVYYEALQYGHTVLSSSLSVFEVLDEEKNVFFFDVGCEESLVKSIENIYSANYHLNCRLLESRHRFPLEYDMVREYIDLFRGDYE